MVRSLGLPNEVGGGVNHSAASVVRARAVKRCWRRYAYPPGGASVHGRVNNRPKIYPTRARNAAYV